ncbi:MAG: hypothetical protein Tsb0018_12530 [Opitutales bacterium]
MKSKLWSVVVMALIALSGNAFADWSLFEKDMKYFGYTRAEYQKGVAEYYSMNADGSVMLSQAQEALSKKSFVEAGDKALAAAIFYGDSYLGCSTLLYLYELYGLNLNHAQERFLDAKIQMLVEKNIIPALNIAIEAYTIAGEGYLLGKAQELLLDMQKTLRDQEIEVEIVVDGDNDDPAMPIALLISRSLDAGFKQRLVDAAEYIDGPQVETKLVL